MKVEKEFFDETPDDLKRVDGIHFHRNDIIDAIDHLSNYAAPGPDGFPAILLKMCKHELAEPLEILFQESLPTGNVPAAWN